MASLTINIQTLALILPISQILMILALVAQYRMNRRYEGPGLWLAGMIVWGIGLALNAVRILPVIGPLIAALINPVFAPAILLVYNGLLHFYGKRENKLAEGIFLAVYLSSMLYFTFIQDDLVLRRAIFGASSVPLFFVIGRVLQNNQRKDQHDVQNYLAWVMYADSLFFIYYTWSTLIDPPNFVFEATPAYAGLYFMSFITTLSWTLGFNLMVNQRLVQENSEGSKSLEMLFSAEPEALIVSKKADGRLLRLNEGFAHMSGYRVDEALGRTTIELGIWHDINDRRKLMEGLDQYGEVNDLEVVLRRKDGSLFTALLSGRQIELQGVMQVISSWHDISERKEHEAGLLAAHAELEERVQARTAELQKSNLSLEKALSARDQFLAAVSHELRTPLTGILGLGQVLEAQMLGQLNEKQADAIKNITLSGQRLLGMINDILDFTQLQGSTQPFDKSPCSVEQVSQAALHSLSREIERKHLQVSTQVEPPGLSLPANQKRLQQVLTHLLSNAVKFTPEGGQIGIQAAREGSEVRLTVVDNGIGIKPEDLPLLFKPFVQLDARLARMYNGTGLGLALVGRLVELHGGRVEVESAPGQGSRFSVLLPAG